MRIVWLLLALFRADAADLDALDAYCRQALEDWKVPGFAIAIVHDGETVLARGYGVREFGRTDPVDEHTLFAIASNTKAFTAAALAMLVQDGKLGWKDAVQRHLPYFELFSDPWISRAFQIEDLLCHRSGLRTFSGDLLWWGTSYTPEEVVRRARFLKPQFSFRNGYGYSNLMFIAAGEVVRAASGLTWTEFVRTRILDPLEMRETVLSVRELAGKTNVASPHADGEGQPVPIEWVEWESIAAAGGMISSVSDLSRWLELQLGEGQVEGRTFYSREQAWKMWTIHNPLAISLKAREESPETSISGSGLGWFMSDYRGTLVARHGGGYDGMYSHTVMAPRARTGVVVLSNSMTPLPRAVAFYALDMFLGGNHRDWSKEALAKPGETTAQKAKAALTPPANPAPPLPLEAYAGTYGGEMYGDATVAVEEGKLILRLLPTPDLVGELVPWNRDVFEIRWFKRFAWFGAGRVQFLLNLDGQPVEFTMHVPNDDLWFEELEFKKRP